MGSLLRDINQRIGDRRECFYWQTDRRISAEEAAEIWQDRHSAISNDTLLKTINSELTNNHLEHIEPFDKNAQTSLGNVNSVRVGVLDSGRQVVIRCHPKGVQNGYFYAESLAAALALENGIPAYKTYLIHDAASEDDIACQVIEKLDGDTVQFYLEDRPEKEAQLVYAMGRMMAKLHRIQVNGFGPFDNNKAKTGELVGLHSSLERAIKVGLDENLSRLVKYNIINDTISRKMHDVFQNNPLLHADVAVLIHNDFADWNLLTDGQDITGVLDWDECVGGHPIQEIACWSTFFDPGRLTPFLEGYFSESPKVEHFDDLFQLFRLRYTISKMALRIKRYTYEQTPFLKDKIEAGKKHLAELTEIFSLS